MSLESMNPTASNDEGDRGVQGRDAGPREERPRRESPRGAGVDGKTGRQGGVGGGDTSPVGRAPDERADLALVQARAAATAFLRRRPLVVVPAAALQSLLLSRSTADPDQVRLLGAGLGLTTLAFVAESLWLRNRQVSMPWMRASLALTLASLAVACTASGGAQSPLLPLLFAPVVTAFAAFGRNVFTYVAIAACAALLATFALLPPGVPFPALPREATAPMAIASTFVGIALSWIAVTGFASAYARTAETLDRLRVTSTAEARERAHRVEAMGAIVAHELKNPLTAIKGLVQMAAEAPATERDAKRLAIVLGEVQRIEATLAEYVAFARPMPALEAEPVDLARLVDDVTATLEGRAAFAGVRLVRGGSGASIEGDARRLREAVMNLATNAIEAMPHGGTLRIAVDGDTGGGATITVEDEGLGLPAGALDQPFLSRKEGGSGIGLLVVQRTAKSHGGRVTASRVASGGSRITLALPASPPAREGAGAGPTAERPS